LFERGGDTFLRGCPDGTIERRDASTLELLENFACGETPVRRLMQLRDGPAAMTLDGTLCRWSGGVSSEISIGHRVVHTAVSGDGTTLIVADADRWTAGRLGPRSSI
jgi:hypothetical protein